MKRYISDDEKYYTYMLKVINSIGGRNLNYNWLITDIEAYPEDTELYQIIGSSNYLFLSNDELMDMLEKDDFQWIWAVFSAIPKEYSKEEVLKYKLPYADCNSNLFKEDLFVIQHPLSDIEIVAADGSFVSIVAKEDKIVDRFKNVYKNSKINF